MINSKKLMRERDFQHHRLNYVRDYAPAYKMHYSMQLRQMHYLNKFVNGVLKYEPYSRQIASLKVVVCN
ncbi:hypothetical protein A0J61_01513 [Choanephora cucurbitarum]|uniref:Uncharacterized protein n=1 Tax=Choanephora cucurbitarum TaxID=101091 RepID=A0A1C7NMS5_9FUNG|nr:hypothetical protein A0J61_01513 [Choanephora cucurbitarum]